MPRRLPLLLILVSALFWGVAPAEAQQQQQTGEPRDPALPDIAPREVEIRGRLDITFPALRRPAPSGLLSEARLAPLPPLAAPQPEAAAPPEATPPALPGERASPTSGFAALPAPATGLFEAGGGRYFSRFGRARLDLPLAPRWAFRARLDYDGTDGFTPFEGEDVRTPSDDLQTGLTLRTEQAGLTARLTADGFLAQHQLYGAERDLTRSPAQAYPGRDRYGGGAALHLDADGSLPFDLSVRYDGARVETAVLEEANERFERSEQRLRASLKVRAPLGGTQQLQADARASTARLTGGAAGEVDGPFAGTTSFLDAGAGLWLARGGAYDVFAGARVLASSGEDASTTRIAPDVRLEWRATPSVSLYARTQPRVEAHLLADRYRENPSLLHEATPQPTLRTVDAEAGGRLFAGRWFELKAFAGYQHASSMLFYETPRTDALRDFYTLGTTAANYGEARVLRAGGTLTLRQVERVHTALSVAVRDGQLTDPEVALPYFAPITAEALFSYGFHGGDGRLQLTGTFESSRPLDRTGGEEVDAFLDFDVEGSYALTPTVGLVVRLQNVPGTGTLERYARYPRPPVVFESGLRIEL